MLHILGMGTCHPDVVITNEFLENLDVGTTAEWIEAKIGILTRVTTLPLDYIKTTRNVDPREARRVASMSVTEMGVQAARKAIEMSGVSPRDIGMVLCNTSTPGTTSPLESQKIAAALGLDVPKQHIFEVMTACPAFALHLDFLASYEERELPEFILCICSSAFSQVVNYNDRTDGAIWGDGAAAYIISPVHEGTLAILDTFFMADPPRAPAVVVDRFGHFHQDGRAVRDFSVRQTVRLIKKFEEAYPIDWNRDAFIGHQANRTMLEQVVTNRKIPPEQHWHNVTYLGNQAGAGAPATLSQSWNKLQKDQKIVIAVVGAGLSWGSALLEVRNPRALPSSERLLV